MIWQEMSKNGAGIEEDQEGIFWAERGTKHNTCFWMQIDYPHFIGHQTVASAVRNMNPGKKFYSVRDHIIKHITPNPLVELKRSHLKDPSYQSLRAYIDSLDKLTGLDVQFVFPGHGEYLEDLPGIIASYKNHYHQRMDLLWQALKKNPRSLYDLVDEIFPDMPQAMYYRPCIRGTEIYFYLLFSVLLVALYHMANQISYEA